MEYLLLSSIVAKIYSIQWAAIEVSHKSRLRTVKFTICIVELKLQLDQL